MELLFRKIPVRNPCYFLADALPRSNTFSRQAGVGIDGSYGVEITYEATAPETTSPGGLKLVFPWKLTGKLIGFDRHLEGLRRVISKQLMEALKTTERSIGGCT